MDEVEQGPTNSKPRIPLDLALEAQLKDIPQASLACFSGQGSNNQQPSGHKYGIIRAGLHQEMY